MAIGDMWPRVLVMILVVFTDHPSGPGRALGHACESVSVCVCPDDNFLTK